ncbi:MAG: IS110 family transposase [Gammaproteobacteria bacterium]|nr:IS110 family transposase [Gammaproteobacteria bacterium]
MGYNTVAREKRVITHTPEAIDEWARELRTRFDNMPVALIVELAKGPVVNALRKYDFIVLFPINPASLAKYREVFTNSGAKDDPTDAELALDFLLKNPERLHPLMPQSATMRTLEQLVESRRKFVNDQTRMTNRITSALKNHYPQPLQWFPNTNTTLFCDFLSRWPDVKSLRNARRSTLERFLREHNVRGQERISARIELMKAATPLTEDPGVVEPAKLLVSSLVEQLRATISIIAEYDQRIASLAPTHPDFAVFQSFPGAGPTFAPRLLAAFGEQRERYADAGELQRYCGVAPVTERSGNSTWIHWRWQCPKFLRQTFVEWAALTIPHSTWARAFYVSQKQRGKSHRAILRALAFKWIRILFRCWTTGHHYDETAHIKSLQKRRSPVLNFIAASE